MPAIRPWTRADVAQTLSINAASQPHVASLDSAELDRLSSLSSAHIVVEEQGCVLAYALVFRAHDAYDGEEFLNFRTMLTNGFAYVDQIAVKASERGTGLGRLLYEHAAQQARARADAWLCCEVNLSPANPASLAFHARMGFLPVGEMPTRDGRIVRLLTRAVSGTA